MKRWVWLLPLLAIAAIAVLRISGPPDLLDKDQPRPIEYILDAAADGNWIVQCDAGGSPCSKPPVYTWLAAISSLVLGGNRLALYLPCAGAIAVLVLMAFQLARCRLGMSAGLASGMILALSLDAQKAVALARTDAVFAACVGLAAWLALRAWEHGRGWLLFWLMCAVVSLAKSPVGVVFAACGLAAMWWGARPKTILAPQRWPIHFLGALILLAITGGWFLLAYQQLGQPLIDRMLGRELIGHLVANDHGKPIWKTFWQPPAWYLGLFMPWSLLCIAAVVRLIRSPPAAPRRARFLRFMACWLGLGLLLLCIAPHKRMVLALPMLLPGAILAGAEAGRWLARWSLPRQLLLWCSLTVVIIGGLYWYHHHARDTDGDRIADSQAILDATSALSQAERQGFAIGWVAGAPATVRYFLPHWDRSKTVPDMHTVMAKPGPAAFLVPAGTPVPEAVRRVPYGRDIEIVYNREANQ